MMLLRLLSIGMLTIGLAACTHSNHECDIHEEHEEPGFQYTSYSNDFELFAEADAFVAGQTANVLSHFSSLPDFKAIAEAKITLVLTAGGRETRQTSDKPIRKGIYSFDIVPETTGNGSLRFEIECNKGRYEVVVPEITVYATPEAAHEAAESLQIQNANTVVFTKEQSWKVDFASDYPKTGPFGQVIKTTALVQAAQGNELIVTAKSAGIVLFSASNLFEGKEVNAGQPLFTITGNGLAENNISVKFAGAKSDFEKAKADYDRARELANDKIVSEKELNSIRNQYETAKAVFDNLSQNTGEYGQSVTSPLSGFIKQVFIKNGSYVETGQAVMTVSQNKTLVLTADVPQRYAHILGAIHTAHICSMSDNITYNLEQLNGKVLSFGRAVNTDNYMIPVTLQIDNRGNFIPGSFVVVYLKTLTNTTALTIPVSALLEEQGHYFVWTQVHPELFEKREVYIGNTDGISVEITGGLAAKERIVTRGTMLVKLAQSTGTLDTHSGHVH